MKEPFVSIIILNFNGRQWFQECFGALQKLNYPEDKYEVILGDNASQDDSVEYTQKNFPWIRVVKLKKNYGFCKGNNLAAQEAKGEYLVFLNNDTFVTKDWLSQLVRGVLSDPQIISCASKILIPHLEDGTLIQAAGGVILPSGCGMYEGWFEKDSPAYQIEKETGFGCGAGVLIQKDFFIKTGGFDEYYFYSGEEMDLGFRVWLNGYKVLFVPSAVMYHYMNRTGFRGKGTTPTIEYLCTRNNLYFIFKNFELLNVFKGFFALSLRVAAKMAYALRYGNKEVFFAILRAYGTIFKDWKKIRQARQRMQAARKVTDNELLKRGILIGIPDMIKRTYVAGKNTIKYQGAESLYDTKDAVKLKVDEEGDFVFYKAGS